MKRTPFFETHVSLGAKMVDFGGWEMPVQYEGIIAEHLAVRNGVGVFDVSHMGQVLAKGSNAKEFVQNLITNDVEKIGDGQALYSPMCNERGGIVDDLIVYKFDDENYFIIVNASTTEKDYAWMQENKTDGVDLTNASADYAQLAVQGPKAAEVVKKLASVDVQGMKFMSFAEGEVAGAQSIICRTGYTGEDGFELCFSPQHAQKIWQALFEAGKEYGITACGLGARDSLRLEAGLMLYGQDMDDDTTPLEAPLKWTVELGKEKFIGKTALQNNPPRKKLVGFELLERAIPRHLNKVFVEGREAGVVTSGTISPVLNKPIGFAFVPPEKPAEIEVEVRPGKRVSARTCTTRFYVAKKAQ